MMFGWEMRLMLSFDTATSMKYHVVETWHDIPLFWFRSIGPLCAKHWGASNKFLHVHANLNMFCEKIRIKLGLFIHVHIISLLRILYSSKFILTLVLLNKLRCHAHFLFSANQITWSRLLIQIQILTGKLQIQITWLLQIYTVCKGRAYPCSTGQGLMTTFFGTNAIVIARVHCTNSLFLGGMFAVLVKTRTILSRRFWCCSCALD